MPHVFSPENRTYVSKRLRTRLVFFFVVSVALIALIGYDAFTGGVPWWMVLVSLAVGVFIGYLYGRFARVRWNESEEKIIMRYDTIALVIIGVYILFSFARDWLLSDLLSGAHLETVSLAVLAGLLFGRFFGLHSAIMRVLRTKKEKTLN
jgi:hypothetical protein